MGKQKLLARNPTEKAENKNTKKTEKLRKRTVYTVKQNYMYNAH